MTQTQEHPAQLPVAMPAKPDLVAETIRRFDTAGLRSQMLKLDTVTLESLGMMLADRATTKADAYRWLNTELGGTDEQPAINFMAVYRYANHFRRLYSQVRAEHVRRIARLTVEHASDGHVGIMRQMATTRLVDLITEKLIDTDDLGELEGRELGAAISTLQGLSIAQLKTEELKLKQDESDRKTKKLESDLAIAQQKLSALPDRIKALQSRLDEIEQRSRKGQSIDPSIFAAIRDELVGLAGGAE